MIAITLDPNIFRLGAFALTWHGAFAAAGIAGGLTFSVWLARKVDVSEDPVLNLAPWAILGGILGARLVHVVDNWETYAQAPGRIFLVNEGGIALYGAIVGGSAVAYLVARIQRLPAGPIADLAAPGLLLGQAIGRIGDLINGEHLSTGTTLPWATLYLHPDSPGSRFPVHPAVGYELIWDLGVLAVLILFRQRLITPGMSYWVYLALYSAGRFVISFLRLDPVRVAGLQISQAMALVAFYVAVFALIRLARRPAVY